MVLDVSPVIVDLLVAFIVMSGASFPPLYRVRLRRLSLLAAYHKDCQVCVQVWLVKNFTRLLGIQGYPPMNVYLPAVAKIFEICDREEPDIGSVVPFVTEDAA